MATTTPACTEYIESVPTYQDDENAAYVLPNNDQEHARLDEQAEHLSAIMNHQIIHAPVPQSSKGLQILDVGCGTGTVTDYLGERFPAAEVYGLDLTSVPASHDDRPSNVYFVQGNILTDKPQSWGLDSDDAIFDLIFSRLLVCGMDKWREYISTSFDLLKPNGYLEIHDMDWIWYDKSGREISDKWPWWQTLKTAGEKQGLDWACGSKTQQWMRDAGLVEIKVEKYFWPFGGQWEKTEVFRKFGDYIAEHMVSMVWHMIPKLLKEADMDASEDTVRTMREAMKKDFQPEEGKHWVMYVTVGKRPPK